MNAFSLTESIQNIEDYKNLYEDEKIRNNKLRFLIGQREQEIEKLLAHLSRKQIVTPLLRNPNEVLLRKELEKMKGQMYKAESLIERYIQIIEELYKLIESMTGMKIDKKCLDVLKNDRDDLMKKSEENRNSLVQSFLSNQNEINTFYSNLDKLEKELKKSPKNNISPQNERDKNNLLLDSFMLDEIQRRKVYYKNPNLITSKKKQVLIEFNTEIEDTMINVICEKILIHPETRATLCDLDFSKIYSLSTKPFNFRLVHKRLEEDNGMIHPPGKSPPPKKRPASTTPVRNKFSNTSPSILTPKKKVEKKQRQSKIFSSSTSNINPQNDKSEGEKSLSNLSNNSANQKVNSERSKSHLGTRSLPKFSSTFGPTTSSSLRNFMKEQEKKKFTSTISANASGSKSARETRNDGILKPLDNKMSKLTEHSVETALGTGRKTTPRKKTTDSADKKPGALSTTSSGKRLTYKERAALAKKQQQDEQNLNQDLPRQYTYPQSHKFNVIRDEEMTDTVIAIEVTKANFPIRPQINESSLEDYSETDETNKISPTGVFGDKNISRDLYRAEVERLEKEIGEQRRNLAQQLQEAKDEIKEKYEREKKLSLEREKVHSLLTRNKQDIKAYQEEKELINQTLKNLESSIGNDSREYIDATSQAQDSFMNGEQMSGSGINSLSASKQLAKEISFHDLLTMDILSDSTKKGD